MGVKGLWRLLLPIGRRISIESLEGQVLAIDASIWLTQFLKAMRDKETGRVVAAAHLIGFFNRICKLQYNGIRCVFVFDGSQMPELKRQELARRRKVKEQFARLGDASIHRLARKILSDQLKLQKKTKAKTAPTAMAAGFNPGGQEEEEEEAKDDERQVEDSSKPAAKSNKVSNGPSEEEEKKEPQGEFSDLVDTIDLTVDLPEDNEWDAPVQLDGESGGGQAGADADHHNSHPNHRSDAPIDIHHIAALPPDKRKDAIETAKRQHRLQSRKEFMPAAADPLNFSRVQMSNFLKSSRLNHSIEKLVMQSVQGPRGQVMQSDRTMRLELIREDAEHNESDGGSDAKPNADSDLDVPDRPTAAEQRKRRQRKQVTEPNRKAIDNEDDDAADRGEASAPALRRIIDDADSSSDDEVGGGGIIRTSSVKVTSTSIALANEDSEDEGEESVEGGFLKAPPASAEASSQTSSLQPDNRLPEQLRLQKTSRHGSRQRPVDNENPMSNDIARGPAGEAEPELDSTQILDGEQKISSKDSVQLQHADESAEDDDEIDWEDGNSETSLEREDNPRNNSTPLVDGMNNQIEGSDEIDSADENASRAQPKGSARALRATGSREQEAKSLHSTVDDHSSPVGPVENSGEAFSAETTAALKRAQTTASNLANWAGVVFRRAMKEVGSADHGPVLPHERGSSELGIHQTEEQAPDMSPPGSKPNSKELGNDCRAERAVTLSNEVELLSEGEDRLQNEVESLPPAQAIPDATLLSGDSEDFAAKNWNKDRNQRERDMDSVTDEMREEVIQLLQLFGVPFVEAPAEAEAQCAALEKLGIVHGVVTEDSDVFAFGGKTVYKHIFQDQKYVEVYKSSDAENEMAVGRNEMVALAMLLGSDYTEGVKGVGIVNAMEVIQAFDMSRGVKEGLLRFKAWLDGFDARLGGTNELDFTKEEREFAEKHKTARNRWTAPQGFPSDALIHAYTSPVVDASKERFSWGVPDVENLVAYCAKNIGWSAEETQRLLDPVVSRMKDGYRQTRIDSFMTYKDSITFADVRSKRLRSVLGLAEENIDAAARGDNTNHVAKKTKEK